MANDEGTAVVEPMVSQFEVAHRGTLAVAGTAAFSLWMTWVSGFDFIYRGHALLLLVLSLWLCFINWLVRRNFHRRASSLRSAAEKGK